MKEIKIEKNLLRDTVKFTIISRDVYGSVRSRKQITVPADAFNKALREAEITVPWQEIQA